MGKKKPTISRSQNHQKLGRSGRKIRTKETSKNVEVFQLGIEEYQRRSKSKGNGKFCGRGGSEKFESGRIIQEVFRRTRTKKI